jgi:hypothetical protein
MAKSKKDIAAFQQALRSKTQYITDDAVEETVQVHAELTEQETVIASVVPDNAILIDEEILSKIRVLAEQAGKSDKELIHHALSHYLMLKGVRLRDAMMKLYKKEISLRKL